MSTTALRLVLGTIISGSLFSGAVSSLGPAAAQACNPSYPEICIGSISSLTCAQIGFPIAVIHDPTIGANDPYHLDTDFNGVGCEGF